MVLSLFCPSYSRLLLFTVFKYLSRLASSRLFALKKMEMPFLNCFSALRSSPNISLLYKDTEHGWNAQLASSFTGTKLALVSPFKDADQWDKAMFGLDLSAEKQFKNGISIFFKANNLLDAKRERYLKTVNKSNLEYEGQKSDKTIVGTYKYGRTFLLGVRYKL